MGDFFMDISDLMPRVGGPRAPLVFDVRRRAALEADGRLLPGARWRDHGAAGDWAEEIPPGAPIVVYCVHGHQVSQSAAARLRARGHDARVLRGGIEAWRGAGGVTIDAAALPDPAEGSRWVMGLKPEAGAVASAWFLRRFVDPAAEVLFVEAEQAEAAAEELQATPLGGADLPDLLARFGVAGDDLLSLPEMIETIWRGQLALAVDAREALAGGFALLDAAYAARRRDAEAQP